jgi:hypothetical protein
LNSVEKADEELGGSYTNKGDVMCCSEGFERFERRVGVDRLDDFGGLESLNVGVFDGFGVFQGWYRVVLESFCNGLAYAAKEPCLDWFLDIKKVELVAVPGTLDIG